MVLRPRYWMLRAHPELSTTTTVSQTGVSGRSSPKPAVTAAARQALPTSSRRNPKTRRKAPDNIRTSIAPRLEEKVRSEVAPVSWTPDYLGLRSPRWARQEQPTHP